MAHYDIFLSYSHGKHDKLIPQAYRIYKTLINAGFSVWFDFDQMKSSHDVKKQMRTGINNSSLFVALLSPDYMKSYNCNYEFAYASAHKPIVAFRAVPGHYTLPGNLTIHPIKDLISTLTPLFVQ